MSSFKKADGIIDSIQKQATGLRTLDGSAIEDFLSIAGYEKSAGGGENGVVIINDDGTALDKTFAEIYELIESGTPCYISYTGKKASSGLDETSVYQVDLFPVVLVFKYNSNYRIMAVATSQEFVSSDNSIGTPAMWTYSATDSSSYPTFLRQTFVPNSNVTSTSSRDI